MRKGLLFSLIIFGTLTAPGLSTQPDSAIIYNSGSTNTAGFTITVWPDANARASVRGQTDHAFTLQADLASRFFRDLHAASLVTPLPRYCMKSASFGSITTVQWRGWRSPDLLCPPFPSSLEALAQDVNAIESAAGIARAPHRIGLPPSLRKIPSATPEVQPT